MFLIPGSLVFPTAVSSRSAPALHVDEINWDVVPPEFKKEGSDWFTVSNPKTERVLDVSPVHTLHCIQFVPLPPSVSNITRANISCD